MIKVFQTTVFMKHTIHLPLMSGVPCSTMIYYVLSFIDRLKEKCKFLIRPTGFEPVT